MKHKTTRLPKINHLIESGRYLSCLHLEQRENERGITRREVLNVLLHGFHEKKEDDFDEAYQKWHYAIRGMTLDAREFRVFISFDEMTIIITTYEIGV